jgi:hypothetical protein
MAALERAVLLLVLLGLVRLRPSLLHTHWISVMQRA